MAFFLSDPTPLFKQSSIETDRQPQNLENEAVLAVTAVRIARWYRQQLLQSNVRNARKLMAHRSNAARTIQRCLFMLLFCVIASALKRGA